MFTLKDNHAFSITSPEGLARYNDFSKFCRHWRITEDKLRTQPTLKEAKEYLYLRSLAWNVHHSKIKLTRKERALLNKYELTYDWRDIVTGQEGQQGFFAPDGKMLLPEIFEKVSRQTNTIEKYDELVPVFNGEGWGLAIIGGTPVMLTPFIYKNIIIERWEHHIYFVQSSSTGKWGALRYQYVPTTFRENRKHFKQNVKMLEEILPLEYDEILEDEICTDCEPTLFWVTRKGDKLGLLTYCGFIDAIFDGYSTDWECHVGWFKLYKDGKEINMSYSLEPM